jgi:hypothetical protein
VVAEAAPSDTEALAGVIRERLPQLVLDLFDARSRQLVASLVHTPVAYEVIVAPAGAPERLLARQLLALPGAGVDVVLPEDPASYLERFASEEERREVADLCAGARMPTVIAGGPAQRRLLHHVIESCDVVVALVARGGTEGSGGAPDDGGAEGSGGAPDDTGAEGSGGAPDDSGTDGSGRAPDDSGTERTGGALENAASKGRPVVRIPAAAPGALSVDRGHGLNAAALGRLEMFNGFALAEEAAAAYVANLEREHFDNPEGRCLPPASPALVRDRLAPFYARASLLAKRNQALYQRAGMAVWTLFPLATAAVAAAVLVPRFGTAGFAVHLVALLLMAAVVFLADRTRSHEKWLECRFLTERIRSGIFLAASGFDATTLRVPPFAGKESWRNEWAVRAFEEIWRRLPRLEGCDGGSCAPMLAFVRKRWLEDQIGFHERKAATAHRRSRRLENGGRALFVLAVLVAIAHLVIPLLHHAESGAPGEEDGVSIGGALGESVPVEGAAGGDAPGESVPGGDAPGEGASGERLLAFLAIVLPGAGAALGGYRAHREYSRLAKRSAGMALELRELAARLDEVRDPEALGNVLREVEQLMLAEVQDWLMLMRFVPVEPPG